MKIPVCKDEIEMEMNKVHQSMTETTGKALTVSEMKKESSNLLGKEIEHLLVLQNVPKGEWGDKKTKLKMWMRLKNAKPLFFIIKQMMSRNCWKYTSWDGWHSNWVATRNVKTQAGSGTFKSLPKEEKSENFEEARAVAQCCQW